MEKESGLLANGVSKKMGMNDYCFIVNLFRIRILYTLYKIIK